MTDGPLPYEISPAMLAPVTPRPSVAGGAVDDALPRDIRKTGINPDFWYPKTVVLTDVCAANHQLPLTNYKSPITKSPTKQVQVWSWALIPRAIGTS